MLMRRVLVGHIAPRSQFRRDGDGQEAVDSTVIPRSFYPGNIFSDEGPLEKMRIRPSVVNSQSWANVERTKSTTESVQEILQSLTAHGVTFIILKADQRPWFPPKGYQCVYESYFQNDTRLWFPIPRIVTAYALRKGVAFSQLMNGSLRLMVVLSVVAAEAGTSLSVRSFEELTSVSITEDGLVSTRMRPSYNVVTGYPSKTTDWQRFYFYVKSNRSAFEEPPRSSYRVLWNAEMVGHPNFATYSKDWKERARTIALQRQDCWVNFTRDRIQRSIDRIANQSWISEPSPHIKSPASKRLLLFPRVEQKEINRARAMKELPDLSRIMAARTSAKKGGSGGEANPPGPRGNATLSAAGVQAPKEGSSKKAAPKKKKKKRKDMDKETKALRVAAEDPEEPSSEEVPLKKRRKKKKKKKKKKRKDMDKETKALRVAAEDPEEPSSEEEELRVLVPDVVSEGRTSDDDENQTIAARIRSREQRLLEENPPEVAADYQRISGNPIDSPIPGERRDHHSEENSSHVPEGSETRVPGRPRETPEDDIRFEFNRELPLSFYPEECGRLIRSVKGGPNSLPPVGGLIFEEEYGHAACSSVKSHGDWNVLVEKYDAALKRAREQVLVGEEERGRIELAHKEALQAAIREKEEAVAREKALRKEFNEMRFSDLAELESCRDSMKNLEFVVDKLGKEKADLERARAADLTKHVEEANRLRKSRKYEVTHERVHVMIAMISKAERCFNRIRLRETQRDAYDEARCLYSQAFGTRACLEQIRDSGVEIPPETIAALAEQEEFFRAEAARLEVKEIPEEDLLLSPLVLKSQFLVEDV
ncbi:hypothetical protein Bca52824_015585 [Brassica carinata]|uniref:Uncharacterized protein n=1 Tax=Brassica carinata TaxID=52824 RepID=A0A8X8B5N6_BRACI|nr:hypothetical protein Bca52824_015585 [Brassica carinata]